ncbi:bifunctional adenosylcobinamide kinase/adenosylcobinamide-phosphate guanylyltransferase [Oryzomicrobium terrae]|uniref:Bifunctional adenosylcobalamin biosynthesis protein n=1 Tax=Oryzomicrobium terrae TaxID=1735038 RepID=A0A5C1EBU4_9RHOO|nr:bifunctional adenosylcobinamide kinase/adenosylcobinamide-phosphate guanylyltransferase [Oryzomicrobium terrae]QEL66363.1 bifunctional adenosylcobinamide kinase/adenosylcobinamide-phosphate guanylyltransferase [Oryzomicrobium terrae]
MTTRPAFPSPFSATSTPDAAPPPAWSELVVGGARSGKSAYAENLARTWQAAAPGRRVTVVATAEARDDEMRARITRHRAIRPTDWLVVEEPLALADALTRHAAPDNCLVVDCLTLWLTNLLFQGRAAAQAEAGQAVDCPLFTGQVDAVLAALPTLPGMTVLVSNEVGWGIVPMGASTRLFTDEQGRLNQRVASVCTAATLVAAGCPLALKRPA